jgi:hypothetical protein
MHVIPYAAQWIDENDIQAVAQSLRSPFLTQGPTVERLERALAEVVGVLEAVAVSSGTAALHLACDALGMKQGAVGVVSPISFSATANCLRYCGAEVRFADVDPLTGLMDPQSLEDVLDHVAKEAPQGVVIPVSLAGRIPALCAIKNIASKYNFSVLEDAAQSFGAFAEDARGRYLSASCVYSDAATLSFHPVKHICAGEGGAVLTNNLELANRIRLMRSHGIVRPFAAASSSPIDEPSWYYEQLDLGFNYRITDIQCALALSQLHRQPFFMERRRALAQRYHQQLSQEPFSHCLTCTSAYSGHAYHLFVVHFKEPFSRDHAHAYLKAHGIMTQVHHVPIYRHPYYEERYGKQRLPGAERYFKNCLSIPLYPKLKFSEQDRVIQTLEAYCNQAIAREGSTVPV